MYLCEVLKDLNPNPFLSHTLEQEVLIFMEWLSCQWCVVINNGDSKNK